MDILQLESVSKALRRNIRPFDVQQYLRLTSEDVSKVAVKFMQGGNKGFDFEGLAEALLQLAHEE